MRKNNKRALIVSALSLLLCVSMLVGSTMAWFTDNASTGVSNIVSGTLDIELLDGNNENAQSLEGKTLTFKKAEGHDNEAVLFEPGAKYSLTQVWLHNAGKLHAKYQITINGIDGSDLLAKVLDVYITENGAQKKVGTLAELIANGGIINSSVIAPDAYYTFGTIELEMQTTAGNEYQNLTMDGISIAVQATQATVEYDSYNNTYDAAAEFDKFDKMVTDAAGLKTALETANDGEVIALAAGTYELAETVNVDKAVKIIGFGNKQTVLNNVVFDIDASAGDHNMSAVFENLKFTGTSRLVVGNRTHNNGVGGPNSLPTTSLTIRNCYVKTEFASDSMTAGKGQFVYLSPVYTVKLDLTMVGNTMINAHTIANEDSSPIVNGNGTVIQNVYIANNTFGDETNPCDRYAVKFARRSDNTTIKVLNNTVYGATTADKDFYILDLWQSGSNVQNGLNVTVSGNTINCTPDTGRTVYTAYLESSVKGSNIVVSSDGTVLDDSSNQ